MPKFPSVTARELIRFFEAYGFRIKRKKGSHVSMGKPDISMRRPIIVACHAGVTLNKNDVMTNLKTANLTKEDLLRFLQKKK